MTAGGPLTAVGPCALHNLHNPLLRHWSATIAQQHPTISVSGVMGESSATIAQQHPTISVSGVMGESSGTIPLHHPTISSVSLPLDLLAVSLDPFAMCVPIVTGPQEVSPNISSVLFGIPEESLDPSPMSLSLNVLEEPPDPWSVQEEPSGISSIFGPLDVPAMEPDLLPMSMLHSELEEFPGPASMSVSLELDTSIANISHISFNDIMNEKIEVKPSADRKKTRSVLHSTVLTSSPYKTKLSQEKRVVKRVNVKKGKCRVSKCKSQSAVKGPVSSVKKKVASQYRPTAGGDKGRKQIVSKKVDAKCDASCLYCNEKWSVSVDPFIKCQCCSSWAHTECAGVSRRCNKFVCEHCSD